MDLEKNELEQFQTYLKKKGAAENTIIAYQTAVRQFYRQAAGFSAEDFQAYKQYLIRTYRPSTVNTRIYGINQYIHFLRRRSEKKKQCTQDAENQRDKHSDANRPQLITLEGYQVPAVRRQQKPFLDNIISNEDYLRLRDGLRRDEIWYWYFVVRFLASTGARVSELVQIKAEHLQLGYMDLYSKGGKIRRIYFPDSLCAEGLWWLEKKGVTSGFIFLNRQGGQITPRGINSQLKRLAKRYHIDPDTVYPHSFRHLYAKNFLARFNDISLLADLLGHESIETTKIYLTQTSREQKELLDQLVTW